MNAHRTIAILAFAAAFASAAKAGADAAGGRAPDTASALVAAWTSDDMKTDEGMPIENLSFPIDHFGDGTVRAQFRARWALLPDDEDAFVRARGVVVELYDEAGAVAGYYIAENCIFDRATRVGYCEGEVRIEYRAPGRNIRIDGTNMQWNLASRDAKILVSPRVTMSEIMHELGGAFR